MGRKPQPLVVDGHYRYTLSSYDPVSIRVEVPYLTDEEVRSAAMSLLEQHGLAAGAKPTDAWVRSHVEGVRGVSELLQAVREELEGMGEQAREMSKEGLCATELAKRLEQEVPAQEVARAREGLVHGYEMQAEQGGLTLSQALYGMGVDPKDADQMFDAQARRAAEQEAALDALADRHDLRADETELPALMGLSPKDANRLIRDARAHGELDALMRHARRCKAAELAASECTCTYEHETAEQAADRLDQMRARMAGWRTPDEQDPDDDGGAGGTGGAGGAGAGSSDPGSHPHLRLV